MTNDKDRFNAVPPAATGLSVLYHGDPGGSRLKSGLCPKALRAENAETPGSYVRTPNRNRATIIKWSARFFTSTWIAFMRQSRCATIPNSLVKRLPSEELAINEGFSQPATMRRGNLACTPPCQLSKPCRNVRS